MRRVDDLRAPRADRPALAPPTCTLARIWAAARAAGAKDDPCATIAYERRPRYDFGDAQGWSFRGGGVDLAMEAVGRPSSVRPTTRSPRSSIKSTTRRARSRPTSRSRLARRRSPPSAIVDSVHAAPLD
ncbi:MAG TPA: hypothetical protein VGH28_25435 [Polyangiaceae bacterium]|jgi:hypothetical protein